MNYMKQVAEMLGVKLGERFRLIDDDSEMESEFYFKENGLYSDAKRGPVCEDDILPGILDGTFEIARKPWKPKDGDSYWYMWIADGEPIYEDDVFDHSSVADIAMLAFGNCFRTKEQAEAHKDEILAKMREALDLFTNMSRSEQSEWRCLRDEKTVLEFMEQSLFRRDLTVAEQIMDLFDKISEKPLKTGKDYADMYYSANFYTYKTFDELVASEAEQGSYGFTREECEAEINQSIWQLPCGWWVQRA